MQSESETESTSSSSKIDSSSHSLNGEQVLGEDAEKSSNKDVIPSDVMEKIRNFPDVIEYIKSLQKYIDKQCRKLGKLKAKVKVLRHMKLNLSIVSLNGYRKSEILAHKLKTS